jgi:hypothetical protein
MAGAHGVPVDAFGGDALAPAPLDGLIDAEQQRTGRGEGGHQQAQQHATHREARPARPVQDAMVALEAGGLRQPQHPQRGGDRPFARSEQRAGHQHEHARPDAAAEQWYEWLQSL